MATPTPTLSATGVDPRHDHRAPAVTTQPQPPHPNHPTNRPPNRIDFDLGNRIAVRAMQRRLARNIDGCTKLRQCGLPVPAASNGPGLVLVENGRPVGGQLVACMSPLRCGYCSPLQWRQAADRLSVWSLRHELAGGWILHSALTVRHSYSDDFKVLVDRLFAAWRRRSSGDKRFRRTVEGSGLVSVVPVFQVTWSVRAGFHPHFHVVWFGSGDEGRADVLSADVDRMWRKSVEAVGLPKAGRAAVHSELITNSQGFVEYLDPDHERHPNNDCVHPDHPGCGSCRESEDSGVDEWGTGGGGWDGGGSSDPWASMQVLSDVGMSGVRGNRRHQAVMAEYLSGLRGRRRVVSGFDRLGSAYGPVDLRVVDASPGGARCWVHPRLVAQVELCRHGGVGSLLHDGLAVASADPVGAAGLWGDALGRRVVVGVHREDGAPVLSLADGRPSL